MNMLALAYQGLPHIDDVEPISDEDGACLDEIRTVLDRYGKTDRFGICLLHQHFAIGDGEILVETCVEEDRTLTLRPVNKDSLPALSVVETVWRFDRPGASAACWKACVADGPAGSHRKKHVQGRTMTS
jgi:hypothetical protein